MGSMGSLGFDGFAGVRWGSLRFRNPANLSKPQRTLANPFSLSGVVVDENILEPVLELRGKLLAGILGMIMGDLSGMPFGAAFGFILFSLLGHYVHDRPREISAKQEEYNAYYRRRRQLVHFAFSLCAKLAKADGHVSQAEIGQMERLMRYHFRLQPRERAEAISVWKKAKDSPKTFEEYAREFYQVFGRQRYEVLNMMDMLFALAASDGGLNQREEEVLLRIAGIFHLGRMQYDRIKGRYFQLPPQRNQRWTPLDPYYAILGAEPTESIDSIKKKFRTLAIKWHPDKVHARGASAEAQRHAKEKFQQINEAYEKIVAARKI
jgi:DnaJ like chaperone protein